MNLFSFIRKRSSSRVYSRIKEAFPQLKRASLVVICGEAGKSCVGYKLSKVLQASQVSFGSINLGSSSAKEALQMNGVKLSDDEWLALLNQAQKLFREKNISRSRENLLLIMGLIAFREKSLDLCIIEDHASLSLDVGDLFQDLFVILIRDLQKNKRFLLPAMKKVSTWILGSDVKDRKFLRQLNRTKASVRRGLAMGGFYDDENMDLASMLLKMLSKRFPITDTILCEHIRERPKNCFEVIPQMVFKQQGWTKAFLWTVLDKGTNPESFHNVLDTVFTRLPSMKRWLLLEIKDPQKLAKYLKGVDKYIQCLIVVCEKDLMQSKEVSALNLSAHCFSDQEKALQAIFNKTRFDKTSFDKTTLDQGNIEDDLVLVIGENLFIEAFRNRLHNKELAKKDSLEELFQTSSEEDIIS